MKKYKEPMKAMIVDQPHFRLSENPITIFGEAEEMYQTDVGLVSKYLCVTVRSAKPILEQMNHVMRLMKPVKTANDKLTDLIANNLILPDKDKQG